MSALVETTATLAHELNQPLAAIATYAQAARVQATSDDAKKLLATLDKVMEQALRAGAVVKRVQGLVKGVAGDSERFEEADVNALLAGVGGVGANGCAAARRSRVVRAERSSARRTLRSGADSAGRAQSAAQRD